MSSVNYSFGGFPPKEWDVFHTKLNIILTLFPIFTAKIKRNWMIEVKNIKKSYGTLQVLKGIDLIIPEKQIVTIVGASGAGKSTLLHIIGTLDYPDEGEVWYEQDNVAHYSANKLANFRNNNIGFVFQFHHLLPEFTALENVCMPAWIKGVPRKEAEKKNAPQKIRA